MTFSADRNLLFGLLALQNGMISRDQLVSAFGAWTGTPGRSIADYLVDQGALTPARRDLLDLLAAELVATHDGDPEASLAALDIGSTTRDALASLGIESLLDVPDTAKWLADSAGQAAATTVFPANIAGNSDHRFRIVRHHARGGLGAVFVALDTELNREVALKQILDQHADDPSCRRRFLIEAEITGGLEHPGIVPVYSLGSYQNGRPFYAMRFIKGDSLRDAIKNFHAVGAHGADAGARLLELRKLLRRFTDVCNAIEYAHSRGVLHRDIKPANVIVGRYGETLVVDWGLAKPLGHTAPDTAAGERTLVTSSAGGSAETQPGLAVGTPAYMSPEQACGDLDLLGPRSDVYSLGATLYSLLTGKAPFNGGIEEVLCEVQRGNFPPPRQLDPSIERALEAICFKAMAADPQDRYPSCRALAEEVERWAADEPVTAYREPFTRRVRRWAKRNRTVVTAAAVAVVAGVVGLSAVVAVQTRANRQLARSKAAVQTRYELAVDAIKTFHTGVTEDFLIKQDQFKELRDRLLQSAAHFYGELGAILDNETDFASRRPLAQANFELAELTAKVGRVEEALAAHRAILARREELAANPDSDTETRVDVGRSLTAVAALLSSTRQTDEAEAAYRKAEKLLAEQPQPTSASARAALARCRSQLGDLLFRTGKSEDALIVFRLARADQEALAAAPGAPNEARRDLAKTIGRIGMLLADSGQPSEAEFRQSMDLHQQLADGNPGVTEFRVSLAASHNNLGILLARTDQKSVAETEYRKALVLFKQLATANPAVTQLRSQMAGCHNNLGTLLATTGKLPEAVAEFRKAIALFQGLADENPGVTDFRNRLALAHNNLGIQLSSMGKLAEEEAEHRAAVEILRDLVKENPAVTEFRSNLATSHNSLGIVLKNTRKLSQSKAEYREAIALAQKLADDNPAATEVRSRLAATHNNLGSLLSSTYEPSAAEVEYRRAIALHQELADANPAVTEFRAILAVSHTNLGNLLSKTGRPAQAEAEYREALALRQKLNDDNRDVPAYQFDLASCLNHIANLLRESARRDDAKAAYERARTLFQPLVRDYPQMMEYSVGLAETYVGTGQAHQNAGDVADAAADWRRAIALHDQSTSPTGDFNFIRSCCHAGLARLSDRPGSGVQPGERQAEISQAMTWLGRAIDMGFRDVDIFRRETSLDPVRGRDDFRLLMMDVAMPPDPLAPEN